MVPNNDLKLVYNLKIASVGPGRPTGSNIVHEPNGVDLAMKLHYVEGVYFFSSRDSQGITPKYIKETMFSWCNDYFLACGRFRRSATGRPFMKCNDCGVRTIEAECEKTVDEWLAMRDCSLNKLLIYHQPIGPEISFSPSLYIQMTKFKCGGMSLGLSWAHILGDPFSISDSINVLGQFLCRVKSYGPLNIPKPRPKKLEKPENIKEPGSLKRVDPVGDHWIAANNCNMGTFSLYLTASQVSHLLSKIWGQSTVGEAPIFESLCAIIWQFITKVREGHEPKRVTICKKDPNYPKSGSLSNSQIICCVEAKFPIMDSDLKKLANLLCNGGVDERKQIEEMVEKNDGLPDYIIYGANLTFLDLEKANLYGFEWNGRKPIFVHYTLQGVGDDGAVVVVPWPEDRGDYGGKGRVVTVILPENEVIKLKHVLKENGLLHEFEFA